MLPWVMWEAAVMSLDFSKISLTVAAASLLIPFRLIDADDEWEEVTEQLQAIQWGEGLRP